MDVFENQRKKTELIKLRNENDKINYVIEEVINDLPNPIGLGMLIALPIILDVTEGIFLVWLIGMLVLRLLR